MAVYTKILIGMVIGVVVGLTLGPKSEFLEHDTYVVSDGSRLDLFLDPADPESGIELPSGYALRLPVQEVRYGELEDSQGETFRVREWAKVKIEWTEGLALRDPEGALQARLASVEQGRNLTRGAHVSIWLKVDNVALEESGGFISLPMPVSGLGQTVIELLQPVGKLFMKLIKMVIVPLVFSSLLVGVASLGDIRKLGRLGVRTLGLYLVTTAVAVTIGLFCAQSIQPGRFVTERDQAALRMQFASDASDRAEAAAEAPSLVDNLLGIIPGNPIESLTSGNMLQIIFFALILGVALTLLDRNKGTPVVNYFDREQQAMVMIIHMVMAVAPFGVMALIAEVIGQSGLSMLKALLVYGLTVLLGLSLHAGIVYIGLVKVVAKLSPRTFLSAIRPAQLIAFSTSSSSATLPVSMECAEEKLGVSNAVSSFVLPLGSTVNMDGTALYQGVAALFIAQVFGVDLTLGDQLAIVATATMASIGAAGVPGAGIVTLAMVLTATGIPPVGVALILGMDRLLDMFRTAVNVTGDLAVTAVMAASEGELLRPLSSEQDEADPSRGFEGRLDREQIPVPPEE